MNEYELDFLIHDFIRRILPWMTQLIVSQEHIHEESQVPISGLTSEQMHDHIGECPQTVAPSLSGDRERALLYFSVVSLPGGKTHRVCCFFFCPDSLVG